MGHLTKPQWWKLLLAEAEAGNAESQWEVASYYDVGLSNSNDEIIVEQSVENALHWYRLSAEQGNVDSQVALGALLSSGNSVELDMNAAIQWSKKAMAQGSCLAAHNLGTIYRDFGEFEKAYSLLELANKDGDHEQANEILNVLGRNRLFEMVRQPGI